MLVAKKKLEYYPEQLQIEEVEPKKIIRKKKRKSYAASKLLVVGCAIIGLVLSLFILYGYANITKVRLEITELEKQKFELEREKQDLVSELERVKSSLKVEEDAMIKLGMDYPTYDQVVYVDVEELALEDDINTSNELVIIKPLRNIVNLVLSLF